MRTRRTNCAPRWRTLRLVAEAGAAVPREGPAGNQRRCGTRDRTPGRPARPAGRRDCWPESGCRAASQGVERSRSASTSSWNRSSTTFRRATRNSRRGPSDSGTRRPGTRCAGGPQPRGQRRHPRHGRRAARAGRGPGGGPEPGRRPGSGAGHRRHRIRRACSTGAGRPGRRDRDRAGDRAVDRGTAQRNDPAQRPAGRWHRGRAHAPTADPPGQVDRSGPGSLTSSHSRVAVFRPVARHGSCIPEGQQAMRTDD